MNEVIPPAVVGVLTFLLVDLFACYLLKIIYRINKRSKAVSSQREASHQILPQKRPVEALIEWKGPATGRRWCIMQKWFHKVPENQILVEALRQQKFPEWQNAYFRPLQCMRNTETRIARKNYTKKLVTIVVPFYNEKWSELVDTLKSLHENIQVVKKFNPFYEFSIVLIQDGWKVADPSMQIALKRLFKVDLSCDLPVLELDSNLRDYIEHLSAFLNNPPTNLVDKLVPSEKETLCRLLGETSAWLDSEPTAEAIAEKSKVVKETVMQTLGKYYPYRQMADANIDAKQDHVTYIGQHVNKSGYAAPITFMVDTNEKGKDVQIPLTLNLTLIIKKDNRKKHNSHEWFLSENGYCGAYNPGYVFATDCSTLFQRDCVHKLIHTMSHNQNCVVATGKQVVKNAFQQHVTDTVFENLLRLVQGYDFESSFAGSMGAFAQFSFLPVVPGPCGLYNWNLLKGTALEKYFELVNKPVHECGIIENNLKIAEDRILSYFAVFYANFPVRMMICPDAEFYFDAETDFGQFVKQRRRWINGTSAGYAYVIMHPSLIWKSKLATFKKFSISILFIIQLLIYLVVIITPSIFICCLYQSLLWILQNGEIAGVLVAAYIAYYLAFQFIHVKQVFVRWTFMLHILVGAFTISVSTVGSLYYLVKSIYQLTVYSTTGCIDLDTCEDAVEQQKIALELLVGIFVIFMSYLIVVLPLLLTLHNFRSFIRSTKAVIPFYLFLPVLVAWFSCYCAARIADFSWGNRPLVQVTGAQSTNDELSSEESEQDALEKARKAEEARMRNETLEKMQQHGIAYSICVAAVNISLVCTYIVYSQSQIYLLLLLFVVTIPSAVIILLSACFFIFNYQLDVIPIYAFQAILTFISTVGYEGYTEISDDAPKREQYSTIREENEVLEDDQPANSNSDEEEATDEIIDVSLVRVASDEDSGAFLTIRTFFRSVPVSPFIVTLNIVLMSCFFGATNFSYQAIFFDIDPAIEWADNNWSQQMLSITFQLCGFIPVLLGPLGDRYAPKYHGVFLLMCFIGMAISVVPNVTLSTLFYVQELESGPLYYVRAILVIFGNNITATAAVVLFLRASSRVGYLLEFIGTRAVFGALGNLLGPVIYIYSDYFLKDAEGKFLVSLIVSVTSSVIMVITFFLMVIGLNNAKRLAENNTELKQGVLSSKQLKFLAVVFLAFFCVNACYAPIQYRVARYVAAVNLSDVVAQYEYFFQGAILVVIGLVTLTFFKHSLKPVSVVVTLAALPQLIFLVPFVGNYVTATLALLLTGGIYRTFSEILAFYYFAAITQNQHCRLGTFYGAFNVTLIIAQMIGNTLCGELGVLLSEATNTPPSAVFGVSAIFSIVAFATVLKLPEFTPEIAEEDDPQELRATV